MSISEMEEFMTVAEGCAQFESGKLFSAPGTCLLYCFNTASKLKIRFELTDLNKICTLPSVSY